MARLLTAILCFYLQVTGIVVAQYAPPAGQPGSTAIHCDSAVFIAWATGCTVERGFMDISNPTAGYALHGDQTLTTGKADNQTVSLGDGGTAVVTFDIPLANGPGFDFAVFENSFADNFLELAFVEVSSDGSNFFRFPSVSLTQPEVQTGTFGTLDATKIHNLAGKYRAYFGTPFDLEELADIPGLDINRITHVRIVDVVGCINEAYARYDAAGNKINDPWPTPFPSSGFDLDAVGVINNLSNMSVVDAAEPAFAVYPNPVKGRLCVHFPVNNPPVRCYLINSCGSVVLHEEVFGNRLNGSKLTIDVERLPAGLYLFTLIFREGSHSAKVILR